MENISRGPPTFGDFVTIRTDWSIEDVVAKRTNKLELRRLEKRSSIGRLATMSLFQDYRVTEYRLPSPPSFRCNVMRESLSVDSQNIPCPTL